MIFITVNVRVFVCEYAHGIFPQTPKKNSKSLRFILVNSCTFPKSTKSYYINITLLVSIPDP